MNMAANLDRQDDARGQCQAAGSDVRHCGQDHGQRILGCIDTRDVCRDAQEDLDERDRQEADRSGT